MLLRDQFQQSVASRAPTTRRQCGEHPPAPSLCERSHHDIARLSTYMPQTAPEALRRGSDCVGRWMDLGKEVIARLLAANRSLFESPSAPPFHWAQTLLSDLAQARAEVTSLQARLHAIQT